MKYIFLLIIFLIIFYVQVRPLIKNKYYKDLVVYTVVLLTGLTGIFLQVAGIDVPSPARGIELIVTTFFKVNFGFE